MPVLTVQHVTTYSYRRAVGFGEHRMMFRPRDSDDQRLLSWELSITPAPVELRSVRDAFGNIATLARFAGRARELRFDNRLVIDHTPVIPHGDRLAPHARIWPFAYDADDAIDLARLRERQCDDPEHAVDAWARSFLGKRATGGTLDLLVDITEEIRRSFTYSARYEEGVQEPARTLALRNGTCRDYAVLMMEAVRTLGMAARFVSGYVYSPGSGGTSHLGGGSTHAWVEVFLPGCGWTEFDPTNGIVGSRDLIRVASVRSWRQAVPLAGTWTGFPADSLGMSVSVKVGMHDPVVDAWPASRNNPAAEAATPASPAEAKRPAAIVTLREAAADAGSRSGSDRPTLQAG